MRRSRLSARTAIRPLGGFDAGRCRIEGTLRSQNSGGPSAAEGSVAQRDGSPVPHAFGTREPASSYTLGLTWTNSRTSALATRAEAHATVSLWYEPRDLLPALSASSRRRTVPARASPSPFLLVLLCRPLLLRLGTPFFAVLHLPVDQPLRDGPRLSTPHPVFSPERVLARASAAAPSPLILPAS